MSAFDALKGILPPDELEPIEQLKKILRFHHPGQQFVLGCTWCGKPWPDQGLVAEMQEHVDAEHPDKGPKIELDMVWIGPGPAPKNKPQRGSRRGVR